MNNNERINYKVRMFFRIFYVLAFNVYSWYWLYKMIWINQSNTWEDWVNYFFVTLGMHFFVIDYKKFWSSDVKSIKDLFNPDVQE